MDIKKELGKKIKKIRKRNNLTQEQLAEMIDISPRNLCNIEVGASYAKPETLEKILTKLNVSTEDLFSNDNMRKSSELLYDINKYIDKIQDNPKTLEKVYTILRAFIEE